ncbi:hypothetical protein [Sphingobium sp. BYY-5]|nr:hypothetical protein [Sphingobium sp. BYY-5]
MTIDKHYTIEADDLAIPARHADESQHPGFWKVALDPGSSLP